MTARPCLDCGEVTQTTRCENCQRLAWRQTNRRRGNFRQRGYSSRWDRLSRRARRLQPFCLDCGTTKDLTADHLKWPAKTLDDIDVVCGPCNNRRGPARGANNRRNPQ